MNKIKPCFLILAFISLTLSCKTEKKVNIDELRTEWEQMNLTKQETLDWFQEAKYGMFIHWGISSIPGGMWKGKKMEEMGRPWVAEWVQYVAKIPRDEYAMLADQFNPEKFDADAVAKLAFDAGMKYLVITSKHHDGFGMYDSKVSEFDIVDATPYGKDVLEQLYKACKKYGVEFGIYYSHNIDWADGGDCQYSVFKEKNDKEGIETNIFGPNLWDPSPNTFDEYLEDKAYPQVKELLTMFPDMKCLWYDMSRYMLPEQSYEFYKTAYDLQPQMIVNHRIGNDFGDYIITGDNKIPKNPEEIERPWETVGTLNNSWGYKSYDDDWKSVKELLFWLIEIVSKGGNYMLNIGPMPSGEVPEQSIINLREVGKWLAINGEAVYGTSRWKISHEGPTEINMEGTSARQTEGFSMQFSPEDFWFTQKDSKIYAIAIEYPNGKAMVKSLNSSSVPEIKEVSLLGTDEPIVWEQTKEGLEVELPVQKPSKNGYVLVIDKE